MRWLRRGERTGSAAALHLGLAAAVRLGSTAVHLGLAAALGLLIAGAMGLLLAPTARAQMEQTLVSEKTLQSAEWGEGAWAAGAGLASRRRRRLPPLAQARKRSRYR